MCSITGYAQRFIFLSIKGSQKFEIQIRITFIQLICYSMEVWCHILIDRILHKSH